MLCHLFVLFEVQKQNIEQNMSRIYLGSNCKRRDRYCVVTSSPNWRFLSTSNSMTYPRQVWTGLYSLVSCCIKWTQQKLTSSRCYVKQFLFIASTVWFLWLYWCGMARLLHDGIKRLRFMKDATFLEIVEGL